MRETHVSWSSGINILAGLWLVFSPLWVSYSSTGNTWAQVVLGAVVTLLAIGRVANPSITWSSWVNFLIGIYFIVVPWTIHAPASVTWNQVILGIIVAVLALVSATAGATSPTEATNSTSTDRTAGAFYERIGRDRK